MSSWPEQRGRWLASLASPSVDDASLSRELDEWMDQSSPVLEAYREDIRLGGIETARHRWTADYFSRQKIFASSNFSEKRIRHLIEVRALLRSMGARGFVSTHAQPVAPADARAEPETGAADRFAPTGSLQRVLARGDALEVRAMLTLELADRHLDAAYLKRALAFAGEQVAGLCEPYREDRSAAPSDANIQHWTDEYFDRQSTYLELNFSETRFLHLIDVRSHLREQGVRGFAPSTPSSGPTADAGGSAVKERDSHALSPPDVHRSNALMKIGLLVAAGIAALMAVLFSRKG